MKKTAPSKASSGKALPSARAQASQLLTHMLDHRLTLDEAIAKYPVRGSDSDQRFAMLLVLTVLQHLGQIDCLLRQYLDKPLPAKRSAVMQALRIGVAQMVVLATPAHAGVNEAVALIKNGKDAGFAGLVNAVLQKIGRDKPALPEALNNVPEWLINKWKKIYGIAVVRAIAQAATQRPPLDIHTRDAYAIGQRMDAYILRIGAEHVAVEALDGYAEGHFFVQDLAASYPVRLLGDLRQMQVLDLCAAPGGKAMQIIQAGGYLTALDRSSARMKLVKENLARMQMQANRIVADALQWQPSRAYDAILLDAPCTATGTWRRHPEVLHNLRPEDIAEMVALQRALLERAWNWLKPGGKLVYCVCSLEPEEGEEQVAWFTQLQGDCQVVPVDAVSEIPADCVTPAGYVRTLPSQLPEHGGMDGFFAVCFEKTR